MGVFFNPKTNKVEMAPSDVTAMVKNDPQLKELMELRAKVAAQEVSGFKSGLSTETLSVLGSLAGNQKLDSYLTSNFLSSGSGDMQNILKAFDAKLKEMNVQMESVKASAQAAIETALAMSEVLAPGNAELSDMEEEKPVDARQKALLDVIAKGDF